jgi:hypothetical protein
MWHAKCYYYHQDSQFIILKEFTVKRKFSDWILIILIVLFFAIPLGSLAMCEPVISWPKCASSLFIGAFLK